MHCFVFASGSYTHGIFMYHKWQQLEVLHLELSLQLFWFLVICNITDWAESWLSFIFCWKLLNTVNIGFYIWNWERSSFLLKKTSSQFPSFEYERHQLCKTAKNQISEMQLWWALYNYYILFQDFIMFTS